MVGGEGITDRAQNTAELYNPVNGRFTFTGRLTVLRLAHSATLLSNGMVLVAGGADGLNHAVPFDELYNPATGRFTVTGSLNAARLFHTATTLDSGRVLLAGGNNSVAALATAERFTSLDKFALTASMSTPRTFHSAALLNSGALAGDVLIAGGFNYGPLASAEIFNPVTESFKTTGSLHFARLVHTSTRLNDGQVLIAGGETNQNGASLGAGGIVQSRHRQIYRRGEHAFSATVPYSHDASQRDRADRWRHQQCHGRRQCRALSSLTRPHPMQQWSVGALAADAPCYTMIAASKRRHRDIPRQRTASRDASTFLTHLTWRRSVRDRPPRGSPRQPRTLLRILRSGADKRQSGRCAAR